MKKFLLILFAVLISTMVYATAQQPDIIEVDGKRYAMHAEPLNIYLDQIGWKLPDEADIWSSNWRGYIAFYKVQDNKLVLTDATISITENDQSKRVSIMESIFPGGHQVVVDWFSGALILPHGELVEYVHMGYGSTYEKYLLLKVREGQVFEKLSFTLDEFKAYKEQQFEKFKQTDAYKQAYLNTINGNYAVDAAYADDYIKSAYAETYLAL